VRFFNQQAGLKPIQKLYHLERYPNRQAARKALLNDEFHHSIEWWFLTLKINEVLH
jgi:hypothetical protein